MKPLGKFIFFVCVLCISFVSNASQCGNGTLLGFNEHARTPLDGTETPAILFVKMSEGNPGAAVVIQELFSVDPLLILGLDSMNIRGRQIWTAYRHTALENIAVLVDLIDNRPEELVLSVNRLMETNYPQRARPPFR